jgi:phenylacetic acid degradation operon negative regulatory protein
VSCRRLGVEEKTTRQALMRTAASGWLDPEKVGRRTRWRLTASAQKMLSEGADRIYSFTGPADSWDGRWLLVYARIPESGRRLCQAEQKCYKEMSNQEFIVE